MEMGIFEDQRQEKMMKGNDEGIHSGDTIYSWRFGPCWIVKGWII